MRAKKLPSGNWRVRVSIGKVDGKYKYKSFTAPTRKEAEYLANVYLMEYGKDNTDPMFKSACDDYFNDRESVLSPATLLGYQRTRKKHFAQFEDYRLSALTEKKIQAFTNNLSATHEPKTVKNIVSLLISVIKYSNPSIRINVRYPQAKQKEYSIPTDEQLKQLIDLANRNMRIAIMLAAFGTMRRGEICALDYSDVNGNIIHVWRDMVPGPSGWVIKEVPKNEESDRYINFPQKVIDEIGEGEGRIITVSPTMITRGFERLRKKVGLENVRFHDLRHYSASLMHAIGIPDQYIMARGGWKTDTVLKSVYRNVLKDKKDEFTEKTNQYFSDKFFGDDSNDSNELTNEDDDWVRIPIYAKLHNVKPDKVWHWVTRGNLRHKEINGKKFVNANDIPVVDENNAQRKAWRERQGENNDTNEN